ncbi:hypothetical protein ACGFZB_38130 [Streptomyces cinerochromogenes]|uniref:Uncharacterized protein n=1 Tax=Streptomyces cinerochromogenes TaxID=66422 RepID=A0ABW7BG45_9ACTN
MRSRRHERYGIATWAVLEETFTAEELLALAAEAASGTVHLVGSSCRSAWR